MRHLTACLIVAFLALPLHAAIAAKRVALVIGNGAYRNALPLQSPLPDASEMANALAAAGFNVTVGTDLTFDGMRELLNNFGTHAEKADQAVFFYAGYALAFAGLNYLIPIDSDIRTGLDLQSGAIGVNFALDETIGSAGVKLIFLNASHSSPFVDKIKSTHAAGSTIVQAGLAEMTPGKNTLISFAIAPGQITPDSSLHPSLFVRALAGNIVKPGIEIRDAMDRVKQQLTEESDNAQPPWSAIDLPARTYLRDPGAAHATVPTKFIPGSSRRPSAPQSFAKAPSERDIVSSLETAIEPRSREATKEQMVYASLPEFSWPPPAPSTYYVLPDALLGDRKTLGEAATKIIFALEQTGYVERAFFRTEPGGIALVTRLEKIKPDGTPARPDRWSMSVNKYETVADLANLLSGLFFVKTGHYRLIVFILQKDAFVPNGSEMKGNEATDLLKQGANVLPAPAAEEAYAGSHCTVMIYEFTSEGKAVHFVRQSSLTAKEHLSKAGLLSLLGKSH